MDRQKTKDKPPRQPSYLYNPLMNMQQDMAMMSPVMQQNDVANNSPHMLPNMMMPQQQYYQYSYPSVCQDSY